MAANEPLNQLSTTDASNTPAGSDVIGATLDNELRSIKANIARTAREESTATVSAASTLAVTILNKIVPVSGSAAGSTTITLPAAATAGAGFRFTAWKTDNVNNVVIDADGSETINGIADYTMSIQYQAAQFVTDGTSWVTINSSRDTFSNINTDSFVNGVDFTAGTSQSITLSGFPGDEANTQIFFDGVYQEKTTYSLASGVVTFDAVIPLGVSQVEAVYVQLADYLAAQGVSYNNAASGLTGTNVQAAIDELLPKTDATSYGFYTTVNATDPTNDIDISAGQCWDTTRTVFIQGSAMTKQGDVAWSAGNNGGFLDTGAIASDEGYHIYAMINDVDGSVDYIMSLSETWSGVTSKPTNYTKGQLIGFMSRGSAWNGVVWSGNSCQYTNKAGGDGLPLAFTDASLGTSTFVTYTASQVPHNCLGRFTAVCDASASHANTFLTLWAKRTGSLGAPNNDFIVSRAWTTSSTVKPRDTGGTFDLIVDGSRQVDMASQGSTGANVLSTYIWSFDLAHRLEATS